MSQLSTRSIRRKISRPNAKKALDRIEAELHTLIDNGPNVWPGPHSARDAVNLVIKLIAEIYR